MTLNGQRIDQHVILNNQNKETQTGFTRGCQTEDNLLILQYCIDSSYNYGLPLIITSIDYSKAFDSVRRESIVETLMHYKIHPKIISALTNIYIQMTVQGSSWEKWKRKWTYKVG